MTEENKQQNDTPMDIGENVEKTGKGDSTEKINIKEEIKEKSVSKESDSINDDKTVEKNIKKETKVEDKKDIVKKDERPRGKFSGKRKGGFRKKRKFQKREKPEFDQKILSLRRVTRVVSGGRRFSFSAAVVIGDKQNRVGFGVGKSNDASSSIQKAVTNAKKNLVKIKLTDNKSIPYDIKAKFKASEIILRPIIGKGLAVGGAVRTILEFAGVKECGGKILSRSKNHINNAKATLKALEPFTEKFNYVEKRLVRKKPFRRRKFIRKEVKKDNK